MSYIDLENRAFGVSLFERLETNAPIVAITKGPDVEDVLNSIKRNITQLLNSRLGEAMSAPQLGLIDFNDAMLGSHDLALQIKLAIRHCLQCYEPRLDMIDIQYMPNNESPLNISFHIAAYINSSALHEVVRINLLLDNSCKYRVI
ncbi:type VI secretion system baseplate subunit TssE [Photobacterium leiognathi]|uniref:type VI secretion system baseplate subunit TssE n=1 Tax=Photobacterium leiognathi TaxID=553611 RepID=UPI00298210A4|nr:type VI secretion system baseplate subunit TssE [Photobacterium leiognathi]